jgi:DNA-directed RNA polymerase specialized sigma24 family protein
MADRGLKKDKEDAGPTTPGDFDSLLKLFDADLSVAAEKYEVMRLKLRSFFRWRGGEDPDGLVDETMDRVLGRVTEGAIIHSPSSYFYSVARHLLREESEKRIRLKRAIENDPNTRLQYDPVAIELEMESVEQSEKRLSCLKICLSRLPAGERKMILRYYSHGDEGKSTNRKTLADSVGIPLNALRIRVFRIRARLGKCLEGCEKYGPGDEM